MSISNEDVDAEPTDELLEDVAREFDEIAYAIRQGDVEMEVCQSVDIDTMHDKRTVSTDCGTTCMVGPAMTTVDGIRTDAVVRFEVEFASRTT